MTMERGAMKPTVKFEVRPAKTVLMLICPPHISRGLARNQIRASQVREQRLTARAVPQPLSYLYLILCCPYRIPP
jgi:hypothetical protein